MSEKPFTGVVEALPAKWLRSFTERGVLPPEHPQLWEDPKAIEKVQALRPDTWVYLIAMSESRHVKIGFAKSVAHRLREVQSGNPEKLIIRASVRALPRLERDLHEHYAEHRKHGEWFRYGPWVEHLIGAMAAGADDEYHFRDVLGIK